MHINSLQSARVKFNEALGSAKIRTALQKKVRTNNTVYDRRDRVYWRSGRKTKSMRKWEGPGRVVCQDGKIVFVRDRIELIRVSVNRLVKAGREYDKKAESLEEESGDERAQGTSSDDDSTNSEEEHMQVSNTESEGNIINQNSSQMPRVLDDESYWDESATSLTRSMLLQPPSSSNVSTHDNDLADSEEDQTDQRCLPSHPWEGDNGVTRTGGGGEGGGGMINMMIAMFHQVIRNQLRNLTLKRTLIFLTPITCQ